MGDKAIAALAGVDASRETCGYLLPSSARGILVLVALMLLGCNGTDHLRPPNFNGICSGLVGDAGACNDENKCCCVSGNNNIANDNIADEGYRINSGNNGTACVDNSTGKFQISEGARITYKGKLIEGPAEGNLHEIEEEQLQIRSCPDNEVRLIPGGTGNINSLILGDCFISTGTDNQYYMPPNSCLIKINEVQYSVVSCDSRLAGSCLTDLGNGNRVIYVEPCFNE